MIKTFLTFFLIIILSVNIAAGDNSKAHIHGRVTNVFAEAVANASVIIVENLIQTTTDSNGLYSIYIPEGVEVQIHIKHPLMTGRILNAGPLNSGESLELNVVLQRQYDLTPFIIEEKEPEKTLMQVIDPGSIKRFPTPSGNLEYILTSMPGVSTTHELSAQYSVRGGNFDENLVYINGFEVFRPFLVRSGQQEGLSIVNGDLVGSIGFSTGGFEAKYGDKMSSVLDITYRKPEEFAASASVSILGSRAHVEGLMNEKLSYIIGARYRTTRYLLSSLDIEGDYTPVFGDIQSFINYELSPVWDLSFITYFGSNSYQSIPETQETTFGTFDDVKRLTVFFQGQEILKYNNFLQGISLSHQYSPETILNLDFSYYFTKEEENFDIIGSYWLDQVETDFGSEDFGEAIFTLGIGSYQTYARNQLNADIFNIAHRGFHNDKGGILDLKWGIKAQGEFIDDKIHEWRFIDSAGFSIPFSSPDLELSEFYHSEISLNSYRYNAFVQNTFTLSDSSKMFLTTGIRAQYWDYNNHFLFSPRVQLMFEPFRKHNLIVRSQNLDDSLIKNDLVIRFASGYYHQPPFYREFRNIDGTLNPDIGTQTAIHFIISSDYFFKFKERDFKFTTEVYYKHLDNLIPYEFDNTRIRYFARNNTIGSVKGIDFQLYGEFLFDLPSWASLSFMRAREQVTSDFEVSDTYILPSANLPRPTDQLVLFSLYFQDFLPMNPNYKVNLNLFFGSGLPHSPPGSGEYRNQLRLPAYRRADIGFGWQIHDKEKSLHRIKFLNHFKSVWMNADVFNVFQMKNTINYIWIKDVNNHLYGVPNYLTSRRFNLNFEIYF